MISSLKSEIIKVLSNISGWHTKRKLIIFESDDWGSIRMPSNEVFNSLIKEGIDLTSDDGYLYNRYDSLATGNDFSLLFDVLNSVKDSTGRPAVLTPLSIVANPDFKKIQQSDFNEYYYEPFTETLKKYQNCEDSYAFWKKGIENRLFVPQFHGREHLNVKAWMRALKKGHELTMQAFKKGMWGITTAQDPDIKLEFQAAFDFIDMNDLEYHKEVLVSGLQIFEDLFGYRASYFVPPNGPFSSKIEPICVREGIKLLSVSKMQLEPLGNGNIRKRIHWPGQKNKNGLIYIFRNCFFEPVQKGTDWVDNCIHEISTAFNWYKPAVISSHRLNYIGALDTKNRENGLKSLSRLLKKIVKQWPEVEFISSAELKEIMEND